MAVKAQAQITLSIVVDVKATYRYYLLQSSTLAKPSAPTVYPPPTSWDDTEPTYTSGSTNSLYFVDCTVFCDDTFSYSEVSLSSSYEAAKVAYNKAVAAQGTADKAQSDIDNLEIGGCNLFVDGLYGVNSSNAWTDIVMSESSYYTQFGSSVLLEVGQTYTFSVYVDREDTEDTTPITLSFGTGVIGEFRMDMTDAWWTFVPNGQRLVKTFTVTEDNLLYGYEYFAFRFRNEMVATTMRYKGLKLEKGNKATDWTPAPEDKANTADVENEMEEIRETITERYTSAVNTSESIILSALEKYVETSNYEEFKQTLEAQLSIMADEILMNFTTTTEQITNVDGDLQAKFTELYKYISFADGTITLGSSDSAITLTIENDKIVFKRNGAEFGSWDGDYFYTGNIYVRVNESARFGNFAFLPREDGSLMLLKVGG